MLINSLAALALGFALDMLLGDPEVVVYPQYFIKNLWQSLISLSETAIKILLKHSAWQVL